jgi:hypothetical protein
LRVCRNTHVTRRPDKTPSTLRRKAERDTPKGEQQWRMNRKTVTVIIASFVALASAAHAQPAVPQPATAPASSPASEANRPTLIARDSAGNLIRLNQPLERAALAVLPLSAEEKERIAPIFAEHDRLVDGALRHATANISRVARVMEENNNAEIQGKLNELDNSAPMLRNRNALRKALGEALTTEHNALFAAVMREYMQAAAQQAQREAQAQNRKGQLGLMAIAEARRVAAMDVRSSLRRIGVAAWPTLRELLPASGINATSASAMQARLDQHTSTFPDGGTENDKADTFMAALNVIADDQQRVLVDALYKRFAPDIPPMKKVEAPVPEAAPGTPATPPANEPVLQPR